AAASATASGNTRSPRQVANNCTAGMRETLRMLTPLEVAPEGLVPGRDVLLKREDVHELGAFKWRGALPALAAFRDRGATGVVTASTGNHAAATAWAAPRVGIKAIVFVPSSVSGMKRALLTRVGADLRVIDGDFD